MNKNIFKRIMMVLLALSIIFSGCGKNEEETGTASSEKDETVNEVLNLAGDYTIENVPEFVPAKDKFTDTNKKYVLPDGYLYEYIPEQIPDFTNMADQSKEGWMENTRIRSTGEEAESNGLYITNYIPCKPGDIIRLKNADAVFSVEGSDVVNWCYYDENKNIIAAMSPYMDTSEKIVWNKQGEIESAEIGYLNGEEVSDLAYIRINLHFDEGLKPEKLAITVNEEIKYNDGDVYSWERKEYYIPAEWYDEVKDKSLRVKELNKEGRISFVVTSDIHIDPTPTSLIEKYLGNIGKVSAEVMRRCGIPFFMNLGDLSTQSTGYDVSVFEGCMDQILEVLSPIPQKNMLITVGNHDGATGMMETEADPIYYRHQLNNEQRSSVFFDWQRETNPEKQFGGDGTYYYLDDENTKTRYIMLNSFWSVWKGDPETGFVEDPQHGFMQTPHYGQEQLSWFANEALDMPKGYSAIIGTHHASTPKDYEMLKNIISAYVNREKVSCSYTGERDWQSSFIEADYSSAKGELIAIFQGHNHKDAVDMETFEIPCITVTTTGAYYAVEDKNPPERKPSSATETTIDVVTIDKEDRVIYFTRLGAGNDRRIDY